jgi:hypothetical protein
MPSKNSNSAVKKQFTEIALMILDSKEQDLANIVTTTKGDKLICKSYTDFTVKRVKADPNKAAAKNTTEIKAKKIVPFSLSAEVIYLLVYLLQLLMQPDNEQLYNCLKVAINYISDDKLQLSTHKIDDFLALSEFKEINSPLNKREILIAYTKFIIYICNKVITDIINFKKKVSVTTKLFLNIITDLSNIKNCNIFEQLYEIFKEHYSSIPKITKKKSIKKEINSEEEVSIDEDAEASSDEAADDNADEDDNDNADEDDNDNDNDNADEDEDDNADADEDDNDNDNADGPNADKKTMSSVHKAIAMSAINNDSSSDSGDEK